MLAALLTSALLGAPDTDATPTVTVTANTSLGDNPLTGTIATDAGFTSVLYGTGWTSLTSNTFIGLADDTIADVEASLQDLQRLDYYQLMPRRRLTLKRKFSQLLLKSRTTTNIKV